jgi:PTH1 family peptidyl-tRNA hydrolase
MLFGRKAGGVTWLLVCLGNYGAEYDGTRHNMGFMAAEELAKKKGLRYDKRRFRSLTATVELAGERVLVMLPQTYMNLSGEAVGDAARFYKIDPAHILVISDDISLPAGKLRVRPSGSAGGHNGLKNIILHLGSDHFPRIKVGVGEPQYDLIHWVTGKPQGEDLTAIRAALEKVPDAVECVIGQGVDRAMNKFN